MNEIKSDCISDDCNINESVNSSRVSKILLQSHDDNVNQQIQELVNEYDDIFATTSSEIGKTNLINFQIELDTKKPIAKNAYLVPEPKKQLVSDMVQD